MAVAHQSQQISQPSIDIEWQGEFWAKRTVNAKTILKNLDFWT